MAKLTLIALSLVFSLSGLSFAEPSTWKVTWIVATSHITSCPQQKPAPDEFGRVQDSNTITLGLCYETYREKHEKVFGSIDEADEFIARGQVDNGGWPKPVLEDFKLVENN